MYVIRRRPHLASGELNALFSGAWPGHEPRDFQPVLERSLSYLAAYEAQQLVGFLNIAWDGGGHGFILDVTVDPERRRQGIALAMLREATAIAKESGLEWLHVDYQPHLEALYREAGYSPTEAGLIHLPSFVC